MITSENVLRRVRFSPYRKGMGPTFTLTVWDAYRTEYGKDMLGYRLTMHERRECQSLASLSDWKTIRTVLFEGEDFGCSPMHAIDSDDTVKGIMGFLTLRPGDTDPEYFADYTPEQLAYCSHHAEALSCEVMNRFGE